MKRRQYDRVTPFELDAVKVTLVPVADTGSGAKRRSREVLDTAALMIRSASRRGRPKKNSMEDCDAAA